jgi:hypothetical protein
MRYGQQPASKIAPTYWLTRFIILRLLGMIYAIAFLVAIDQILPLIGSRGLLPVKLFIENAVKAYGSPTSALYIFPLFFGSLIPILFCWHLRGRVLFFH